MGSRIGHEYGTCFPPRTPTLLEDKEGFKDRIRQFLTIAYNHGIRTMFVLFDDCWFPNAKNRQTA